MKCAYCGKEMKKVSRGDTNYYWCENLACRPPKKAKKLPKDWNEWTAQEKEYYRRHMRY